MRVISYELPEYTDGMSKRRKKEIKNMKFPSF